MSLQVSLPPELEKSVRQRVESGSYASASEVVCESLRLFDAYQSAQAANMTALKADIALGVADIAAGRVSETSVSDVKRKAYAVLAQRQAR